MTDEPRRYGVSPSWGATVRHARGALRLIIGGSLPHAISAEPPDDVDSDALCDDAHELIAALGAELNVFASTYGMTVSVEAGGPKQGDQLPVEDLAAAPTTRERSGGEDVLAASGLPAHSLNYVMADSRYRRTQLQSWVRDTETMAVLASDDAELKKHQALVQRARRASDLEDRVLQLERLVAALTARLEALTTDRATGPDSGPRCGD